MTLFAAPPCSAREPIAQYPALVPRDAPEADALPCKTDPAGAAGPLVSLVQATPADAESLAELRVQAMRPSLEPIGRFDPQRARQRFLGSFDAELTRWIWADGVRAGFVVLRPQSGAWLLDHLCLHSGHQGQGIGSAVMRQVMAEADAAGAALRVGALRGSDANRFYLRHGFLQVEEGEHDLYYVRPAAAAAAAPGTRASAVAQPPR